MSSAEVVTGKTLFHISLNVADLGRAIEFYCQLLGVDPAKQRQDYAKFELADPPLVLSLEPQAHAHGGALNHLGLRVADAAALVEVQRRMELAGIETEREEGVSCCYARQTKFWIADPDKNHWEVYILEEDLEHRGDASAPKAAEPSPQHTIAPRAWEHHLGVPVPKAVPADDESLDSVMLRGTFNAKSDSDVVAELLADVRRALRAGGKLIVHGLVADRPLTASPKLSGPASMVECIPLDRVLFDAINAAGFKGVHATTLSQNAVFEHEGVPLRELLLVSYKAEVAPFALPMVAIYKGPFKQVVDDFGTVYPRAERVTIPAHQAELLRSAPGAEAFLFLLPCCEK